MSKILYDYINSPISRFVNTREFKDSLAKVLCCTGGGGGGGIQSIVAGTNITIDDTDPLNPIISATSAITGTGTNNVLTKWTGATSLGNSLVSEDATTVNIGPVGPEPTYAFNVFGTTNGSIFTGEQTALSLIAGSFSSVTALSVTRNNTFANIAEFSASGGNTVNITSTGSIEASGLAGIGTRMVVADSVGILSTQAIPSGGVSDGDKGDITVSSSGSVWTIDNDVVTYAKLQNISATNRLLGRATAGAGDTEEITIGSGLLLTGTTLSVSGGSGWSLTGNAGTVAGTNYIGTSDSIALHIRTNNSTRLLFNAANSGISTGTSTLTNAGPNYIFGGDTATIAAGCFLGGIVGGSSSTTNAGTLNWHINSVSSTIVGGDRNMIINTSTGIIDGATGDFNTLINSHGSFIEGAKSYNTIIGRAFYQQYSGCIGLGDNTTTNTLFPSDNYFVARFLNGGALRTAYNINALNWNSTGQIGINTPTPAASAILEITSTTQGVLFPRVTTTQKNAIASPTAGLVVYDTTLNKLCVYTTAWETITSI